MQTGSNTPEAASPASLLLPRSPIPAEGTRMEIRVRRTADDSAPPVSLLARIGGKEFFATPQRSRYPGDEIGMEVTVPFGYRRLTVWAVEPSGRATRLGRRWILRLGPFRLNRWIVSSVVGARSFLSDTLGARRVRWRLRAGSDSAALEGGAHLEGWFWHPNGPPERFLFFRRGRLIASSPPSALPEWERAALGWLPPHRFWGIDQRLSLPQGRQAISVVARMPSGLRIPLGVHRICCREAEPRPSLPGTITKLERWSATSLPLPGCRNEPVADPLESAPAVLALALDHIGDMACTLPALALLRERLPTDSCLTVAAGPWSLPLLERCRVADRVIPIPFFSERSELGSRKQFATLLEAVGSEPFSLALDFRLALDTRALFRQVPARRFAAFTLEGEEDWLWFGMALPPEARRIPWRGGGPHTAELKLALAATLPIGPFVSRKEQPLPAFVLHGLRDELLDLLLTPPGQRTIGLHPASGKSETQWPPESFGRLADLLVERLSARIIFCGGAADLAITHRAYQTMRHPANAAVLAGKASLGEFLDLLPHFDLFVGNDSGPAHLAGLLGRPTLVLFGGSARVSEFHPLGPHCYTLRSDIACSPCYLRAVDCPWSLRCLQSLTPEDAFAAAEAVLQDNRRP